MQTYVVKPLESTVLAGQTHYTLKNNHLKLGFKIDTAHIVPGPVDLERFKDALAAALSVYPLFAGRMQRARQAGEPWQIRLTDDGVPVTVVDSDAAREVPHNCVVQSPWTLSQPVRVAKYCDFDSDEPLLRVTVTRFVKLDSTCIGLSGSHVASDGFMFLRFLRLLSQHYQGLPPLDALPTYTEPAPRTALDPEAYKDIPTPDIDNTYALRDTPPFAQPGRTKPQRVDLQLSTEQVAQNQAAVRAQAPSADEARTVSRQDALASVLMFCMGQLDADCVPQDIRVTIMNRGHDGVHPTAMTNGIMWAVADRAAEPAQESAYAIARRMRDAIVRARQPAYIAAWDAAHADKMLASANAERGADFTQGPHEWIINSTWRFDWTSAHFGYEGQTRFFHTIPDEPRCIKMFAPNPVRVDDGSWVKPAEVEATFYLHKEAAERFRPLFVEELRRMSVHGECRWL